ncbi:hypothetical protein EV643_1087 [Kribbella sp. VKM Ac-2527]|uniref:Uncharacterized protein n=1 Tax=Kribbella caucasensis TaxID=2512215 RepID=A0A4R6KDM5_9ACTN|nr:hypothetical protein [Kribbella sp. VKM Ac-2527]TDO47701.1 hypothetical protein EV643_1087 [Kribbella sp. VKM Ac-2527]
MTAQDQYRRMLKECVTPALRERGWRGGSGKYYLHGTTGHVGSVILSGNHRRSAAQVRTFHVHIGVASQYLQEFQEGTGRAPLSKRPSYALDHDWFDEVANFTITSEDDPLEVGAFVWMVLETQAIPRVAASLDDDGLRSAVDGCPVGAGRGGAHPDGDRPRKLRGGPDQNRVLRKRLRW